MSGRRPGVVVSIRVNPKDCLTAIDVVEKLKLNVPGISFSQVVSVAFSSAMESLRQSGIVPDRDGFEYSEMMSRYPAVVKGARGRALQVAETFSLAMESAPAVAPNREVAKAKQRHAELLLKAEADPLNMTDELRTEMEQLTDLLMRKGIR